MTVRSIFVALAVALAVGRSPLPAPPTAGAAKRSSQRYALGLELGRIQGQHPVHVPACEHPARRGAGRQDLASALDQTDASDKPPAIIADVDETLFDNGGYESG